MSSPNSGMGSATGWDAGFAKLQGQDFDYFIQSYETILGRNTKKEKVDLDLTAVGGAKDISRRHARIYYDFTHRTFALEVLGKNGCYVERVLYLPGDDPVKLDSQDHIQIGGTQFYFLHSAVKVDDFIAAQGTPQTFSFRCITYHVDPVRGSVWHTPIPSQFMPATDSGQHTHFPSQPMAATASAQHTHFPSQPIYATASARHNYVPSKPMSATASARHTHTQTQPMSAPASARRNRIPSQPMSTTTSARRNRILSQPMAAIASAWHNRILSILSQPMSATTSSRHTHTPSQPMSVTASARSNRILPQPMSATGSARHTHTPSKPISATASARRNRIPSQPMSSSSMRPVHPGFSTLRDYNYNNSHGRANGESGTVFGSGTQRTFMKQNNRSLVQLDLNLEPIIETPEEDEENGHGCANGDSGIIVGTGTQGNNMEQNNMSFGELDLNVKRIGTPNEDAANAHGCTNGGGIIVGTGTQGPNMEQNNRSFGELDLNVEPIRTVDENVENGHGLANGDSGAIVSTGTQGTVMEQIYRSLDQLDLNVKPIGTLSEHVNEGEIRTDRDTDNPQLRQKEENDLMSSVASLVSNHPSPNGWVPAADVHAELVAHFSKIWHHSRVQKYLASEAGSSTGAVEKPWHKLLELLRSCPEKFVVCTVSRGAETSDFVGYLHPPVMP